MYIQKIDPIYILNIIWIFKHMMPTQINIRYDETKVLNGILNDILVYDVTQIIISYYCTIWNWKYKESQKLENNFYVIINNKIVFVKNRSKTSENVFNVDCAMPIYNVLFDSPYIYVFVCHAIKQCNYYDNKFVNNLTIRDGLGTNWTWSATTKKTYVKNYILYVCGFDNTFYVSGDNKNGIHHLVVGVLIYLDENTQQLCNDYKKTRIYPNDILVNDDSKICIVVDNKFDSMMLCHKDYVCMTGKKIFYCDNVDIILLDLDDNLVHFDRIDKETYKRKIKKYCITYLNKTMICTEYKNRFHIYHRKI